MEGHMVAVRKISMILLTLLILIAMTSCVKETQEVAVVESTSAATDYTQLVTSTVVVERAALRPTIEASTVVQGQNELIVKAKTSGVVQSVDFQLGQKVEAGTTLVTLEATAARLAASQLSRQVENARKEVEVQTQLHAKGAVSLSSLNQSKATLEGLESQLERAQATFDDTRVSAPIAGSIADGGFLPVVGDTLQAGQTIARIIDLDNLRASLSLGQSQIFSVHEGANAVIEISTPNETIKAEGVVRAISSGSDARTGSWTVLVDFPNPRPELIRSGVSAKVTIENDRAPLHPLVPNAAMVNRDGKTYVYVRNGSTADLVEVAVVDRYGDNLAIRPIDEDFDIVGSEVLVSGLSRIEDGSSVATGYEE